MIVVPFEKSITTIGLWLTDINKSFQEKQNLIDQNEELKNTVDTLTEQNNILIQNQSELSRLQELYDLMRNIRIIRRSQPELYPKIRVTGMIHS